MCSMCINASTVELQSVADWVENAFIIQNRGILYKRAAEPLISHDLKAEPIPSFFFGFWCVPHGAPVRLSVN